MAKFTDRNDRTGEPSDDDTDHGDLPTFSQASQKLIEDILHDPERFSLATVQAAIDFLSRDTRPFRGSARVRNVTVCDELKPHTPDEQRQDLYNLQVVHGLGSPEIVDGLHLSYLACKLSGSAVLTKKDLVELKRPELTFTLGWFHDPVNIALQPDATICIPARLFHDRSLFFMEHRQGRLCWHPGHQSVIGQFRNGTGCGFHFGGTLIVHPQPGVHLCGKALGSKPREITYRDAAGKDQTIATARLERNPVEKLMVVIETATASPLFLSMAIPKKP